MENRFGIKDLILTLLLVGILITQWLAMTQDDRQWDLLRDVDGKLAKQTDLINRVTNVLENGVQVSAGANQTATGSDPDDPFHRLRVAQQQPDFARGDWLIDAFGVAVGKLTPLISSDVYARTIENQILETLAQRDPDTLEWKPLIAHGWSISDDGLTITFDLRDGVRFSDGEPLTARDVVYTYRLIMNPKIAAPRARAYFEKVKDVRQEGDHRVVFEFKEPYFRAFETCAGMAIQAEHFYSRFTEAQYNEMPGLLFGSGPYQLSVEPTEWTPGNGKIELVRNDQYWGPKPAFDRLVFREITDDNARLTTFKNGELDRFSVRPEQYKSLKADEAVNARAKLYEYETVLGGYRYIGWNQHRDGQPTRFADKRVRQAMTMLIDRQEICQRIMVGLATVSTGPFHHLGKQASPSVDLWPYDPNRAKALLKQAGFEDRDGDSVIDGPGGQPFRFKLIYPSGSANYQEMALYLKDAYARAGVILEPEPLEWTIMIQRIDQRDFDAMTLGWSGSVEGDPYQIFHSEQIADGGDNYIHYQSPELDQAIDQARQTIDEAERMNLWHRCHEILHEDQPYTFLLTPKSVTFIDRRIQNVQLTPLGLNAALEWYVPLALQTWSE